MRGETMCPTCGGPCDVEEIPSKTIDLFRMTVNENDNVRIYRTTADPARLARLESLLREIGEEGWRALSIFEHTTRRDRIAALLGPAE